ncbi:MAG: 50S ribosomal protein L11 methyltransferase [Vicinamibacterales bacterium]
MKESWPALVLEWDRSPGAKGEQDPAEAIWAALGNVEPAAVHETESAWKVFFGDRRSRDQALLALASSGRSFRITAVDVEDEDWARRTQAALGAVKVGRFVVAPPWAAAEHDGALIVLPSMGFGSGHHATTRLCLVLLQAAAVEGKRVVDIGTGSGILAIAACRLGAVEVTGIDVDPDALENARENVELNGMGGAVSLRREDFRSSNLRADIITANLTSTALTAGARQLASMVEPLGRLIVSGFLETDEATVASALSAQLGEAHPVERAVEEGWVALAFTGPPRRAEEA